MDFNKIHKLEKWLENQPKERNQTIVTLPGVPQKKAMIPTSLPKKPEKEKVDLFREYSQKILNAITDSNVSIANLMENWINLSKNELFGKTIQESYTINAAYDILRQYNSAKILVYGNTYHHSELVFLANTINQKGAKAFTFDQDDDISLKFLLSSDVRGNTVSIPEFLDEKGKDRKDKSRSTIEAFKDKNIKDSVKEKFFAAIVNAFYELGLEFEKVRTNSAYRTGGWQAKYLLSATGKTKWDKYTPYTNQLLYLTQSIRNGIHSYTDIVQYRELVNSLKLEEYLLLEKEKENVERIKAIKEDTTIATAIAEIEKDSKKIRIYEPYFLGAIVQTDQSWEDVLADIFNREIFVPSRHIVGQAFDVSINKSGKNIYDKHPKNQKYGEDGFGHLSFNI